MDRGSIFFGTQVSSFLFDLFCSILGIVSGYEKCCLFSHSPSLPRVCSSTVCSPYPAWPSLSVHPSFARGNFVVYLAKEERDRLLSNHPHPPFLPSFLPSMFIRSFACSKTCERGSVLNAAVINRAASKRGGGRKETDTLSPLARSLCLFPYGPTYLPSSTSDRIPFAR